MSFDATVFNVMIASPSDVTVERNLVREAVYAWNAMHAITRKAVLLPSGWETHTTPLMGSRAQSIINSQVLAHCDLLVAVFWTRLGTATGNSASGTIEEIETHLATGRPTLLYFSSAPVQLDSVDQDQYQALTTFRKECKDRGLYETYDSPGDFRVKIDRHLNLTLNQHPYFVDLLDAANEVVDSLNQPVAEAPQLSREAQELLVAASTDGEIMAYHWLSGSAVQAGGRNFVEDGNPRSEAIWFDAVDELERAGLCQGVGKREIFRLTRAGFDLADKLKA